MKEYVTKEIVRKESRVVKTICDLCKKEIITGHFSADDVRMEMTEGNNYPEGGSWTTTTYDVCVPCFNQVIIPFMEDKGADYTQTEHDN